MFNHKINVKVVEESNQKRNIIIIMWLLITYTHLVLGIKIKDVAAKHVKGIQEVHQDAKLLHVL